METLLLPSDATEKFAFDDFGRSFKFNAKGSVGERVFMRIDHEKDVKPAGGTDSTSEYSFSQSTESMLESIKADASISMKFAMFEGSAAGKFALDNTSNAEAISLLYCSNQRLAMDDLLDEGVVNLHPKLLDAETKEQDITEAFGTHFIKSMIRGTSMRLSFKLTNTSSKRVMDIKAGLKGKITLGMIEGAIEANAEYSEGETNSSSETHVSVQCRGVPQRISNMPVTDLESAKALIAAYGTLGNGTPEQNEADKKDWAVVALRIAPLPKNRIPIFAMNDSQRLWFKNNVAEVQTIYIRYEGFRSLIKAKAETFAALPEEVKMAFAVTSDLCDTVVDTMITKIQKYLTGNPLHICDNRFKSLNRASELLLMTAINGLSGGGVLKLTLENSVGKYIGYLTTKEDKSSRSTLTEGYKFAGDGGQHDEQEAALNAALAAALDALTKLSKFVPNYTGDWTADRPSDKTWYSGQWSNGTRSGKGRQVFRNGDIYNGEWWESLPDGKGKMKYSNPMGLTVFETYDGEWISGEREGNNGVMTYTDKSLYDGNWTKDQRNGLGKMTYVDKSIYYGNWANDQRNGPGNLIYDPQMETVYTSYDGRWANDKREGKGVMVYGAESPYIKYDGLWENDLQHGQGTMEYKEGKPFTGEWINGVPQRGELGPELVTNKPFEGGLYTGYWSNDLPNGQGTLAYGSASKYSSYVGEWLDGMLAYSHLCSIELHNSRNPEVTRTRQHTI
jgi:hypothetical protein